MLCQGILQEANTRRKCWLPASEASQVCRRCHFYRTTETLDLLTREYEKGGSHPENETLLEDHSFLEELLHPAREQALLNLLSTLYTKRKEQFSLVVTRLEANRSFPILIKKRIEPHQPGTRCAMYRGFLQQKKLYKWRTLCWSCWPCIAWSLKQRDNNLLEFYIQNFGTEIFRLTEATVLEIGSPTVVDLLVSLYLLGYHHHIRVLLDHMLRTFTLEVLQHLLLLFFQEAPLLPLVFEGTQDEFLPLALRSPGYATELKQKIKKFIKRRTNLFKEELIQVTWHPDRVVQWCLDLDDKSDF